VAGYDEQKGGQVGGRALGIGGCKCAELRSVHCSDRAALHFSRTLFGAARTVPTEISRTTHSTPPPPPPPQQQQVYGCPIGGSLVREQWAIDGSGSTYIWAALDDGFK